MEQGSAVPDFRPYWSPFRKDTSRNHDCLPYHTEWPDLLRNTEILAYLVRSYTVWEMTCAALGHPGGSFSEAEFLSALYNYQLRFRSGQPGWDRRDIFYLSKCHACPSLYTVLALFGYFSVERLAGYGTWDAGLESHPDCRVTPGIEISGGSLGQIPGVAVGRAIGLRKKGPDHADRMIYALLGDGECEEGSVWEAFMAAGHYRLDNLVFAIDYNKVQAKGFLHEEMGIEPLADKLASFRMDVHEVRNGHDVEEILRLLNDLRHLRRGKPIAVILNTMKGKKVRECQYNVNWHTSAPRNAESGGMWIREIWEQDGRRLGIPEAFPDALAAAITVAPPLHDNPDELVDAQA